jgi:hypothetical protein
MKLLIVFVISHNSAGSLTITNTINPRHDQTFTIA